MASIAGAVPGVLLGLAMMATTYAIAVRRGFPHQPWQGLRELGSSFMGAFWAIFMTGLIVGGLLSGLMTPTETAVVASLYALVADRLGAPLATTMN